MNMAALVLEVAQQTGCDEQTICALVSTAWPRRDEFTPTQARIVAASIERRSNPALRRDKEILWSQQPSSRARSAGSL